MGSGGSEVNTKSRGEDFVAARASTSLRALRSEMAFESAVEAEMDELGGLLSVTTLGGQRPLANLEDE